MVKLLETIRLENGRFYNLTFHQERMNNSRKELFGYDDEIDLVSILQAGNAKKNAGSHPSKSRFYGFLSCRQAHVLRSSGFAIRTQRATDLQSENSGIENPKTLNFQIANLKERKGIFKCRIIYSKQIEKIEFIPYQLPNINTLKVVTENQISYDHKYLDRNHLDQLFQQKENCDDILIVKNNLVTDTYFANIVFYNGTDWVTPAKPLLKGTQRASLLEKGMIKTADIHLEDLRSFEKARLINAMIRFEDEIEIEVGSFLF